MEPMLKFQMIITNGPLLSSVIYLFSYIEIFNWHRHLNITALAYGYIDIVKMLVQYGADVKKKENEGALHLGIRENK